MNRAAILALALLAGCNQPDYGTQRGNDTRDPTVYMDRDTGCEYLTVPGGDALTPRMNMHGRQECRRVP